MFYAFIKGLGIFWPFLKELILRNKTLKESIRNNKTLTTMFLLLVLMFSLVLYNADNVLRHGQEVMRLRNEKLLLELQLNNVTLERDSDKVNYETQLKYYREELEQTKAVISGLEAQIQRIGNYTPIPHKPTPPPKRSGIAERLNRLRLEE